MPEILWYYARRDERFGPVTGAELKRLASSGGLAPDDLLWREGMPEWAAAGQVRGLFGDSAPTTADVQAVVPKPAETPASIPKIVESAPPPTPPAEVLASPAVEPVEELSGPTLLTVLTVVQAILWSMCVTVVLLGGVLFAKALLSATSREQEASAGVVYSTFFIGAYVVARAGEKISQLVMIRVARRKQ